MQEVNKPKRALTAHADKYIFFITVSIYSQLKRNIYTQAISTDIGICPFGRAVCFGVKSAVVGEHEGVVDIHIHTYVRQDVLAGLDRYVVAQRDVSATDEPDTNQSGTTEEPDENEDKNNGEE